MRVLVAALCLLWATAATGQERILAYDSEVRVNADGSLDVTEHIRVRAEGASIRRGIYRDFPTRYRDRRGNRYVVAFEVLGVERNGQPEPWFTERMSNGVRLNTGNDEFLPLPAEHEFTLRYRTTRQLGFFRDHDELYWNAIGTGWVFPIESSRVEVRLPTDVPPDQMSVEGYTGRQGATGQNYVASVAGPGRAVFDLTAPLAPGEGFTIVVTFPKGVVAEPGAARRAGWLLRDNSAVLVALLGLLLLLVYCIREWKRVGRDPRPGIIIARYEPPAEHTPSALRYMLRTRYDMRCFSADVLELAVNGHVRVSREKKFLKDRWRLDRLASNADPAGAPSGMADGSGSVNGSDGVADGSGSVDPRTLGGQTGAPGGMPTVQRIVPAVQQALLNRLFSSGRASLELTQKNATTLQSAQREHARQLEARLRGVFYERNTKSTVKGLLIALATLLPAFFIATAMDGAGLPFVLIIAGIAAVSLVVFSSLVKAPTTRGRALLDEIEGLKLYLSVAERDELSRLPGPDLPPPLDAGRYEMLLPYAMALEVEDAWTKKFTAAVGAAAAAEAARRMSWYSGPGPIRDIGSFTRAVGSSLNSQISSSSNPPGSSSGSGGGGSSGGGGGGGGGGGR